MFWIVIIFLGIVAVCFFLPQKDSSTTTVTPVHQAMPMDIYDAIEAFSRTCAMCQSKSNAPANLTIIIRASGTKTHLDCKCTGDGLAIYLSVVPAYSGIEAWNDDSSILSYECDFDIDYEAIMLPGVRTSIFDGTFGQTVSQSPDPCAIVLSCNLK